MDFLFFGLWNWGHGEVLLIFLFEVKSNSNVFWTFFPENLSAEAVAGANWTIRSICPSAFFTLTTALFHVSGHSSGLRTLAL